MCTVTEAVTLKGSRKSEGNPVNYLCHSVPGTGPNRLKLAGVVVFVPQSDAILS